MPESRWEHFDYGAMLGVRGIGPSRNQAFEQAGLALIASMTDPSQVADHRALAIECTSSHPSLLLIDWLNILILEITSRQRLFGSFCVEIEGLTLRARANGEAFDPARHALYGEPRAVTPCELRIARVAGGHWVAQCVLVV